MALRSSKSIHEPARDVPVVHECDVCVIGGGGTGVFAAVRAARLGATVALVENNGFFGGIATAGLVNIWHSIYDTAGERQIIGGLTVEVIERLQKRDAVRVMVHCNQTGEAAGVACALALHKELDVSEVDSTQLRRTLTQGGSQII